MRVRDYQPSDRAACLVLFDSNVPKYFQLHERVEFAEFLDDLPGPYLVLEEPDRTIVGCGGYARESDGRIAHLCWGMVAADQQGRGLGQRLTEERIRRACADFELEVLGLDTSQRTRAFYERFGFVATRVTPDGYGPGLDRVDMRLALH